ncbi:hypothetical protein CLOSTHATH_02124 [Hungatella hathewayi DSM 13479]|uniref:Uncharacterized protein n=1 Tax=Hungatella hathewayi DSM 13479 TaxID=566550 RepID=D3AEU0_9FIRM|nr:hypothetical protein CLOSTHATH_02124 [Hungatella hathewayi DSM 13479]
MDYRAWIEIIRWELKWQDFYCSMEYSCCNKSLFIYQEMPDTQPE